MCILCVASKWSRRIVTMLPWLIFPLVLAWAVSQLLPPGFRFEVTSPRLACVGVLLLSLAWYELVMPRLSEWRARRSLLLHERRKIQAQEAAKWRKEAIRKCRNCFMAYKDQKPQVGGKFMCTFCGHLSKRPALHVPGLGHYLGAKEGKPALDKDVWPGVWMGVADNTCSVIGGRDSGVLIVFRLVSFLGYCVWWACSKLWRGGMMSDAERLRTERKAGHRKGDDGGGHESKVDRVRRKAEEKRLARLEKEQMEAEERLQREEVARLVDERRRQRADAHKGGDVNDEGKRSQEHVEHKKQDKNTSGDKQGNGNSRCAVLTQDDSTKKSKERGKRDKKADDCTAKAATAKPVGNGNVSGSGNTNGTAVKVEKGSALKAAAVAAALVKPSVSPVTKPQLVKVTASAVRKQEKHVSAASATNLTSKVTASEGVVSKPSAWNRISWAWGKGSGTRTSKTHESSSEGVGTTESKPPEEVQAPPVQPVPVDDDVPALSTTPVSMIPSTYEDKSGTPSADSSPFLSQSVYSSTFMPSVPASDAATEVDLASKSTWKMWEAPNLELPRLTRSLVSDERCFHPALPQPSTDSFLSSGAAVGIAPSVPINNNLWSNYHAFESARRIWEDDLQSEATPPEFVDCITQEVMKDPVIAADGHSYERSAIEAWLRTHDTSPKTGEVLPSLDSSGGGVDKSLRPNHNLRGQIIEYRECMQRGLAAPATNVGWTEPLKKGHIGGLYTPPGVGSVWAFSTS